MGETLRGLGWLAVVIAVGWLMVVALVATLWGFGKLGGWFWRGTARLLIFQVLTIPLGLFGLFVLVIEGLYAENWLDRISVIVGGLAIVAVSALALYHLRRRRKQNRERSENAWSARSLATSIEKNVAVGTATAATRLQLARLYLTPGLDNFTGAAEILREAVAANPPDPRVYFDLFIAETMLGNGGAANSALIVCKALTPEGDREVMEAYWRSRANEVAPESAWQPLRNWWSRLDES